MSKFSDWTRSKLDKRFGLKEVKALPALTHWLKEDAEITDFERNVLLYYQTLLLNHADAWNEQELSLNFIGPVFGLVQYGLDRTFNFFAERPFAGSVDGEDMMGNPDGILAKGWRDPEIPFFCFHEYKKELEQSSDPAGQCLAPMLVAQALNGNDQPIYGCFVIGRYWRFIVLRDKEYAVSDAYLATQEPLFEIFKILKSLKLYIANII
ncbi:MAG: hypothetical protein RL329_827 [Bacteroidota bacterium]|jgi:hypothetical protein